MRAFLAAATRREVLSRSAKIALFVGTVLAFVNHGDTLISGTVTGREVVQIVVSYFVPFCVATWSAAAQASE
jgi:hypothetical protein